ncbi:serine/threonine-protein kinase AFC3-like isoform X1 [Andrographis paniculata]|uniref:serine/threonine-protein kinase AFC3-like isoform X1 n=1 Tax=Andrographis paniculata TaxID=175694 RepID=UPI0021E804CB|nr:serine/threonine-protein kinase AFC3-like isoform X1 [Andrographis paniculata]
MAEDCKGQKSRKRRRLTWDVAPPGQPEAYQRDGEDIQCRAPPASVLRRYVSPPRRDDDREGHYVFSLGENLTPRYKILGKMGEGTFGRVLECWDRQTRDYVAIKVVRSISKYRDAAMIEIDVLQCLAEHEKDDSHCVKMLTWFDYRNHICIVFEKLGPSLFDFLKRNRYFPLPVDLVREFGRQLLESVACLYIGHGLHIMYLFGFSTNYLHIFISRLSYMSGRLTGFLTRAILDFYHNSLICSTDMHDLRLIHTDLKPENILLVSSDYVKLPSGKKMQDDINYRCLPKSSAIKLIDFGSTTHDSQAHSSIVSTRHYRAPEIILGLGWSYPCDLWSVGCILVELCTGEALFQTHENLEHLAMMERVLGSLPEHMIRKANKGAEKYFRRSRLNWPEGAVSRESIRAVRRLDQLKNLVARHVDSSRSSLVDLLYGLLKFDPRERLTARQALRHPFFDALS